METIAAPKAIVDVTYNSKHYNIPRSHSGDAGIERISRMQDGLSVGVATANVDNTLASVISRDKTVVTESRRRLSVGHLTSCWLLLLATDDASTAAIMEAHPDDDYSPNVIALVAAILRHDETAYVTVAHNFTLRVVLGIKSELMDDSAFVDKLLEMLLAAAATSPLTATRVLDECVPSATRETSSLEMYRVVRVCQRWINNHLDTVAARYQPSAPEWTPPLLNGIEELARHVRTAVSRLGKDDKCAGLFEPFARLGAVCEAEVRREQQPVDANITHTDNEEVKNADKASNSVSKRQSSGADADSPTHGPITKKARVSAEAEEKRDTVSSSPKRRGRKPGSVLVNGKVVNPSFGPTLLADVAAMEG